MVRSDQATDSRALAGWTVVTAARGTAACGCPGPSGCGGAWSGEPQQPTDLVERVVTAHGYRNSENYRLHMLLAASGTRTHRFNARTT